MPVKFKAVKHKKIIVDGVNVEKTSHYNPQGLRWSVMKPEEERKPLSKVIHAEKSYNFLPYSYTSRGVTPKFLCPIERRSLGGAQ